MVRNRWPLCFGTGGRNASESPADFIGIGNLGDLKNARSLAEEALRLSQKNNEKFAEAESWLLLGTILGKTEPLEINKAEGCILKAIEIYKGLGIKAYYPLGHLYLGQLYLKAGKKEKAIDNLK